MGQLKKDLVEALAIMIENIWAFLLDENNTRIIGAIGVGIGVAIGALWKAFGR